MVVCVNNFVDSLVFCLGSCFETCHFEISPSRANSLTRYSPAHGGKNKTPHPSQNSSCGWGGTFKELGGPVGKGRNSRISEFLRFNAGCKSLDNWLSQKLEPQKQAEFSGGLFK